MCINQFKMKQLKFFTWHMGEHVSKKDAVQIFSFLEQKAKLEKGEVVTGRYFTEINFENYRIEYNNELSGFEVEGNDLEVINTLMLLIKMIPAYVKMGINRNPHEPDEELFFPQKGTTIIELVEGLKIEERWGFRPNIA